MSVLFVERCMLWSIACVLASANHMGDPSTLFLAR